MNIQIKALEDEISSLVELVPKTQSQIVRTQYERRIEKLGLEIEALQASIHEKPVEYDIPFRNAQDKVLNLLKSPYTVWKNWNIDLKHKLFPFLFEVRPEFCKGEPFRNVIMSQGIRVLKENANSKTGHVDIDRNTLKLYRDFIYKWYFILIDTF